MPRTLLGYAPKPFPRTIKWLERAVTLWAQLNRGYSETEHDDALYWYNERPNIGALAAAAWKAQLFAVEEYVAMKKPIITSKRSGRIDLYVTDQTHNACIEAKQCWVSPNTRPSRLRECMDAAMCDARRDNDASQNIGAVFYVMRISKEDANEKTLRAEIERIRNTRPDAIAWCFPSVTRLLASERSKHSGFVWPGVILALKVAR